MRDAWLVLVKDLRLERRSKVGIAQVLPFAILVLMLFAFALDPDRGVLERATPGLFWVAVLFSSVLTLQRSFGVEAEDGVLDALRLTGMSPAGVFLDKVGHYTNCLAGATNGEHRDGKRTIRNDAEAATESACAGGVIDGRRASAQFWIGPSGPVRLGGRVLLRAKHQKSQRADSGSGSLKKAEPPVAVLRQQGRADPH